MKIGRASTYTGEMRTEKRGHVADDTQNLNPQMATGNGKDFTLINIQGYYSDFEVHLKLFMFRALIQVIVYIPTKSLCLDTIICKHMLILIHIWAFFRYPQGGIQQIKYNNA
jgi:hypothetical protein